MAATIDEPARQRLLDAGARVMAERGFKGASVREICAEAGTSNNMIHHYFGSKQGLLDAIVDQFSAGVFSVPLKLIEKDPRSADELVTRVEMLFETTLEAYMEHRALFLVVLREQADPEALPVFVERFVTFLDRAKDLGFVRPTVDSAAVPGFLLDRILNQVQLAPWIKRNYGVDLFGDEEYRAEWCRSNVDVLLRGLMA